MGHIHGLQDDLAPNSCLLIIEHPGDNSWQCHTQELLWGSSSQIQVHTRKSKHLPDSCKLIKRRNKKSGHWSQFLPLELCYLHKSLNFSTAIPLDRTGHSTQTVGASGTLHSFILYACICISIKVCIFKSFVFLRSLKNPTSLKLQVFLH